MNIEDIVLSNSKIETFDCPRKYYYTYILKLPQKPHEYFILGRFCHRVLELFYIEKFKDKTLDDTKLMGMVFGAVRKEAEFFAIKKETLLSAKGMLQRYLINEITKKPLPNQIKTEHKFDIEVDGIKVTGIIDRIDYTEDGLIKIIDYKTSKHAKTEKELKTNMQLPIYMLAAKKYLDIDVSKLSCAFYFLKLEKYQNVDANIEVVEKAIATINEVHSNIIKRIRLSKEKGLTDEIIEKSHTMFKNKHLDDAVQSGLKTIIKFSKDWEKKPNNLCSWCAFYKPCNGINW